MEKDELVELVQGIINDRGVPRKIKTTLEESLLILNGCQPDQEKLSQIVSTLDDASSNPNLSMNARTHIWNIVSALEQEMAKK